MNDFSLLSNKIEDCKYEKIAFIIDTSDEIYKEDFKTNNNEKFTRIDMIFDEIIAFCKLKDFISSKATEFRLYTYSDYLKIEIDFLPMKEFISKIHQVKNNLKTHIFFGKSIIDLANIFAETLKVLQSLDSKKENFIPSVSEIIVRVIFFYNRSDISATNSDDEKFNKATFIKLTNFYFDIIFLRKRILNEEDKIIQNEVFNSLTSVQSKNWYAFEVSGYYAKFKNSMSLLLANPNQRVKFSDIDKQQKCLEEIVKSYLEY